MAVQPNIPLALTSVDTAAPLNQSAQQDLQNQQQQNQNAQSTEQVLKQHYDNMGERDKQRLQSTVVGAAQLKTYLDKNDLEGAHQFLEQRKQQLQSRQAQGENVDTQETDYALDKIRRGDVQGLSTDVSAMIAAGQSYGMLGGGGVPSNVQEWNYYHSLSPQDQSKYIEMKRSDKMIDLGGRTIVPNPANPAGDPIASYDKTLAPADQPANAFNKAESTAEGTGIGARKVTTVKADDNALAAHNYLREAIDLIPVSTNGGVATAVKGVAQGIGVSTEASRADRKLKLLAAKLTSQTPRFEGPQSDKDVQQYKESAGDLANTSLPTADRLAAAEYMQHMLDTYGSQGRGASGGAGAVDTGALPQDAQLVGTSGGKKVYALPDGSHVMEQ